jgi:ABC-type polysaccharide/polyol phosphate transport system ATPase subunit
VPSMPAIVTRDLGKRYSLGTRSELHGSLRERLSAAAHGWLAGPRTGGRAGTTGPAGEASLWALRHLDLEIAEGEAVGVIGSNGAGKTTLLKILSRITAPTEGTAQLRGRVGSLLEVGTGFHPELTGRENVLLNGAILGMSRAQVLERFDSIVDFAEVAAFIDTPVKHYSSGMHVRLAFAVAAHLDPEILILDEVLAVGDAAFQRKCLDHVHGLLRGGGRTLLLVSHNLALVQAICTTGCLLEHGRLIARGPIGEVTQVYRERLPHGASYRVRTDRLEWLGLANRDALEALRVSDDLLLELQFGVGPRSLNRFHLHLELVNTRGETVIHLKSEQVVDRLSVAGGRPFIARFQIARPRLAPGSYSISAYVFGDDGVWLWLENAPACTVSASSDFGRLPVLPELRGGTVPSFTLSCAEA